MKKRIYFAAICISSLLLGGCSLVELKQWVKANVVDTAKKYVPQEIKDMLKPKKEEAKKEEDDHSSEEQDDHQHDHEGEEGQGGEGQGGEGQGGEGQGGEEQQQHVHSTTASWSYDAEGHYHVCDECGEKYDTAAHQMDNGVITKPASCTEDGIKTFSCEICDYQVTETIPGSHNTEGEYVYDDDSHWKVCSECGEKILLGAHNYDEGNPIVLPTKFETGITRYTCLTCGRSYEVVTPKLDDTNLNVLFVGSALIRQNAGYTETFAGFANVMDGRTINYTMDNALTPTSGYSFNALADETTSLGGAFREKLAENEYDIIVMQVTRMIAKGHDSVAAKELESLQSISSLLKGETSQIYLLTHNSDESYSVFDVDENGAYTKTGTDSTTGAKANTAYYNEKAQEWATAFGAKVVNYGEALIEYQACAEMHGITATSSNCSNYLRGISLYEGIFNKLVPENVTYMHPGTSINDNDLHYLKRYAAQYCYAHEHIDSHETLHDTVNHWTECTICNHHVTSAPHNLVKDESTYVEATCTHEGFARFECECGYFIQETYNILPHEKADQWSHDEEYHWKACANCEEILDKAEHNFDQIETIKAATLAEEGEEKWTCSTCGYFKSVVIPKIVHTEHTSDNVMHYDDTYHWNECTFDGCNELLNKAAHTFDSGVITTQPTRTTKGVKTYTCTACDYSYTEEVDITTTNVLFLGTANMNNYEMDVHLNGLALDQGYKAVTGTYLTLGSGYGFNAIADTSTDESFGSQVATALEEQEFDVIILSINRMVTKGSDDVIAAERAYLSQIMPTLKAETSEIYLMSFNMDPGSTPKKYVVNETTGKYTADGTTGYDAVETSKYN